MSKLFYLIPYWMMKFFLELTSKKQILIETRNSIHFDYFKIFKSDLDLTIISKSLYPNHNAIFAENFLKRLPFVKEINHHYTENLKYQSLQNIFEAFRHHKLKNLNNSPIKNLEAYVFLLRMLQSNLHKIKLGRLDQHSINKWNFYFQMTENKKISFQNFEDIISNISSFYSEFKEKLPNILEILSQSTMTTREKFHALTFKREAKIIFPHVFTSVEFDFNFENEQEELLYITQMSWEVFGLSTQIIHMKNDLETIKHLKNINHQLNNLKFQSKYSIERSKAILNLISSINHYLLLE